MKITPRILAMVSFIAIAGSLHGQGRDFGVDVSHFQGESGMSQATWNQLFAEGKKFAFIKATEGVSVLDGTMAANMNRATTAGILAGVYHFAHPEARPTIQGAVEEADYFLTYAGNFIGPGYLRPVLDLETGNVLSTAALTDWVIAFSDEIVARRGVGAAPIIYCNQSYANNELDNRVANYTLWLRTVNSGANPTTDNPPPGLGFSDATGVFNDWAFWQYAIGSAGGIGSIDLNVCHSESNSLASFVIPPNPNPVKPTIIADPQPRTVRLGQSAAFTVGVSVASSTPLFYQWRFEGTNIVGATASAYTRTNAQLSHAGNYSVIITNGGGSVTSAVAKLTVIDPPPAVPPVVLYQENFDAYSSPSVVTTVGTSDGFNILSGVASGPDDFTARFGFNYSTVTTPTTIPSAPHSSGGTSKGLYLTANKDGNSAAAAVNLYPASQTFTGNFAFKFDMWINYINTSSATEHTMFGVNHSGAIANRVGQVTSDGLFFSVDGDGGVSAGSATLRDFAIFRGNASSIPILLTTANTTFGPEPLLGAQFDNADIGFVGLFPSKPLSFATTPGTAGLGWVSVEVRQTSDLITWLFNDVIVAQFTNASAFTNGNIMIGYSDNFASGGAVDNFVIFDNVRVETVPDVDGNGLADAWEIQYFGQTGVDADADAETDGASNLQEYLAGTNPTNAASIFRLLGPAKAGNDLRVDWTTVGGHSYVVQFMTNSSGGVGTNFVDLSPPISVVGATEDSTNYLHLGGATNKGGYYRVRLGP